MQYISEPKKLLIVGCTPPPNHGQALMIQNLATAQFAGLKLYLVRMSFSKSMDEVGKFNVFKLIHLVEIVVKCVYYRIKYGIKTFYYSPGGSTRTPILRDIVILFFLRLFFKKAVFHFHSAGTAQLVQSLPSLFKEMARSVYSAADLGIYLSSNNLDHHHLGISNVAVVANGLEDDALRYLPFNRTNKEAVTILFVGIIKESKGVMILLQAMLDLKRRGYLLRCKFMGDYDSEEFKNQTVEFCRRENLEDIVQFIGFKQGAEKWDTFKNADLFCFPSYYQSESFGNAVVEAMMFELPVIATAWRGIPDIVDENETGFLVPIMDPQALANSIQKLLDDPSLRISMGVKGRLKYLEFYGRHTFLKRMEDLLQSVAIT